MRVTGICLMVIGFVMVMVSLFVGLSRGSPGPQPTKEATALPRSEAPSVLIPLVAGGAAFAAGAGMYAFGGRGYFVSNNLNVTN